MGGFPLDRQISDMTFIALKAFWVDFFGYCLCVFPFLGVLQFVVGMCHCARLRSCLGGWMDLVDNSSASLKSS